MGKAHRNRMKARENRLENPPISQNPPAVEENTASTPTPTPTPTQIAECHHMVESYSGGSGSGGASSISLLPRDVIFDILSRLPIKTLKHCMWVCKSWYRAVHSPLFATMHHQKSSQLVAAHLTSILIGNRRDGFGLLEFEQNCSTNNADDRYGLTGLDTHLKIDLNPGFKFVGSCNGLLCLVVGANCANKPMNDRLYVCNPVLGDYMTFPPPTGTTNHQIGYGFGFNSATNEYKVIRMSFHWIDFAYIKSPPFQLVGEVHNVGASGWRSIGNVPYPLNIKDIGFLMNGALHWMSDCYVSPTSPGLIVGFDVGTEEFKVVPHPPGYCHGKPENYLLHLTELGGRLCLLDHDFLGSHLSVWVMKEYGVKESWVKQYVVEQPRVAFKSPHRSDTIHLTPLTLMNNNQEILFLGDGANLLCYDLLTKRFQVLGIMGLPSGFSTITHVGSLVSLWSTAKTTREKQDRLWKMVHSRVSDSSEVRRVIE